MQMRVCIHRGAKEIGGSCVEIKSGDETILVDAGLPLSGDVEADFKIPDIDRTCLQGIVISHTHQDHYGLLPQLPTVPILIGPSARRILQAAIPFTRQTPMKLDGPDLIDRKTVALGSFRITPYLVDHSAYDAYALLIEADGRRLFYSGDLRMHGRKRRAVERLLSSPPKQLDALLLEGTTLGRESNAAQKSEEDIEKELIEQFRATIGLALVQTSAQNIDRLVSVFRACKQTNRTLVIDLYTAEILAATGNAHVPQSDWDGVALCIPQRQRVQIKNNQWFETLRRHSTHRIYPETIAAAPRSFALIFRNLWIPDLEQADCLKGASLIHSQWEGYLRAERSSEPNSSWLKSHGIDLHQIHSSGHASQSDLKLIASSLAPKVLVPIHSDMPGNYGELYPNVAVHADGEWWDV